MAEQEINDAEVGFTHNNHQINDPGDDDVLMGFGVILTSDPIEGDGYVHFATAQRRIENETIHLKQAQLSRLYMADDLRLHVARGATFSASRFTPEQRDHAIQLAINYDATESVNHCVERIRAATNVALAQKYVKILHCLRQ
jgi:hypothetical protein